MKANSKLVEVGVPEFGSSDGVLKLTPVTSPTPSVGVPVNCLTIPIRGWASRFDKTWQTGTYRIDVESISLHEGNPIAKVKTVVVNFRGVQRKPEPAAERVVELKVLDQLVIPASFRLFNEGKEVFRDAETFRVKHIVLPDSPKRIIGWCSLEPLFENWSKAPISSNTDNGVEKK